ncbi:MAG: hypothetical protein CMJ18_01870 [Phycisphaeraceae bacterium]|nr:hypothetical protein [Phycisphaeraceae bacterium]
MKLTHEDHGQMTVMLIRGELTADQSEQFHKDVLERIAEQVRDFVLDIGEMDYIDSKGLEAFVWPQDHVADQLGQVHLARMTDNVRKIFEITRLLSRFDCHDDVESAVEILCYNQ